jgi:FkbM family methyltransferase
MEKRIYRKFISKKIVIDHICEVGVFLPELSNIVDFIVRDRIRTTLVEPDPKSITAIQRYFVDYDNVRLLPYAIYDYNGVLELVQRAASTFVADLPYSPAQVNDHYEVRQEDTFSVECKKFDEIDDGSIGLLSVDTEGCEWYVLKYLKSRPLIISLETHGKSYLNPFLKEIRNWMADNGYGRWYMDRTDTIYYRKGAFGVNGLEKMELMAMGAFVRIRRARKRVGALIARRKKGG